LRIRHYLDENGQDVLIVWLKAVHDRKAVTRIIWRLDRVREGNFGDHKSLGNGIWELRIHYGPGYRIYYSLYGKTIVLLFCAGEKSSQVEDVARAKACKEDYERRMHDE
jgi:putative addiction module killer protein